MQQTTNNQNHKQQTNKITIQQANKQANTTNLSQPTTKHKSSNK